MGNYHRLDDSKLNTMFDLTQFSMGLPGIARAAPNFKDGIFSANNYSSKVEFP